MSNLGKKDRQLWYEFYSKHEPETLLASTRIKFLFGRILEHLLLFLAKEAGHKVEHEQKELNIDGVIGHQDATIDDVVVDAKSCSTASFRKFQEGNLGDDPFGYMHQLAGYSAAHDDKDGAFLAIDKQNGDITLLPINSEILKSYKTRDRIKHLREILKHEEPPERCYSDRSFGKSGNRVLSIGCSYCPFKSECWSDANGGRGLRTFLYSDGPVYFTDVTKLPKVPEINKKD